MEEAPLAVEGYYRWQSVIYDATRWSFLFGRSAVLDRVASLVEPKRILEVGCGTGRNLAELARRFPKAQLTGLDVSADMLALTEKKMVAEGERVKLVRRRYDAPVCEGGFDLVLCSYALSMFNPGWEESLECAMRDLEPGGVFALVDIPKGTKIADYYGKEMKWKTFKNRYGDYKTTTFRIANFPALKEKEVKALQTHLAKYL